MAKVSELKDQARELERRGEVDSALKIYRHILKHLEQTPAITRELPLYVKVGDLLLKQGDAAEATAMYERGAAAYARHGSAKSVIALCVKILRVDSSRTDAYTQFAGELLAAGHVAAAREVLEDYARRAKREGVRAELKEVAGRSEADVRAVVERLLEGVEEEPDAEPEPPVELAAQPPILAEPWVTESEEAESEPEPEIQFTHDTASQLEHAIENASAEEVEPEPESEVSPEPQLGSEGGPEPETTEAPTPEPEPEAEPAPESEAGPFRFEEPFSPAAVQEGALAPTPEPEPPRESAPHEPAPPEPPAPRPSRPRPPPPRPRFVPMARRQRPSRSRLLPIIVVLVVAGGGYALVRAGIGSLTGHGEPEASTAQPAPADTMGDTMAAAAPESAAAMQSDTGAPPDTTSPRDTAQRTAPPAAAPAVPREVRTPAAESAAASVPPAIAPPNVGNAVGGAISPTPSQPSKPTAPSAPRTSVALPPGTAVHDVVVIRGLAVDSVSGTTGAYRVVQHTADGTTLALTARRAGVGDTVGVSAIQIAATGRNAAPVGSVRFWGLLVTVRGNVPADTLRAFIGRLALARGGS